MTERMIPMNKMIAIWGSPNSGKTTFATKLAESIYDNYQSTVIVVYADNETPTLPVIFPNYKKEDLFSVGVPLSKTEMTQEDIIKQLVTVKERQNFGFLGFTDGENKYTYPAFDEAKARNLYSVLGTLADYVIVDCTSNLKNPLSKAAIKDADEVIRLATPDLKSMSWYNSQLKLFADPEYRLDRQIQGINAITNDIYLPIDETASHLHFLSFKLPYSWQLKQQTLDGKLIELLKDKNYNEKMKAIVEKII